MRVINGIECIGSSLKGRGCSTKDFDVKISYQKSENGRIQIRVKKSDIILSGKAFLLGFLNGKMYFIASDAEDAITIYNYNNYWLIRSKNTELIERLKDVVGCYVAHYDRKVKAWYIVLNNKEED